ncbi:delta-sarcoglycan [Culicoides brevitarsis]|uniref:delta-sarcoglycan n=1 Tax=Culicoides brevitarsis TaxID=469753 RepID=UPI00307BE272
MSYEVDALRLSRPTSIFQCRSKSGQLLQPNVLNWEFSSECQSFLNYYNNNDDDGANDWQVENDSNGNDEQPGTSTSTTDRLNEPNPSTSQETSTATTSGAANQSKTMGHQKQRDRTTHSSNNNKSNGRTTSSTRRNITSHLTFYGWRKKCLYALVLILAILITINLALTLWILKVMEFSSDGMGHLKMIPGGIQLNGQSMVMDTLRASKIKARQYQPITIESFRNFTINTRTDEGLVENRLFIGHDRFEVDAHSFRVSDTHGNSLFSVNKNAVTVGAHALKVEGDGGIIFKDSIQTPLIRSEAGKDLKLESPTRSLEMKSSQEIFIQSMAGSIQAISLDDLKLNSKSGSVRLDAANINLPNLKIAQPHAPSYLSATSTSPQVYQLCACANGKLFIAAPTGICATGDSDVCR